MISVIGSFRRIHIRFTEPTFDIWVLISIFLIILIVVFGKILPAYYYPAWDQAHHLQVALGYYHALASADFHAFWQMYTLSDTIYPPFFHIAVAIGYLLVGVRDKIGPLVNFPFALLLGFSTYQLSRIVTRSRMAALIAGLLTFFVPVNIDLWTDAMTDITSIALFVTLYWTALKTDYFASRPWSVASGVVALFLVLSRYAFFSAALPLVVYAIISLRKNGVTALTNMCMAGLFLLPAVIWYTSHWTKMYEKLTFFGDPTKYPFIIYGVPGRFELANWLYFPRSSVQIQGIGLLPMLLFLCAVASGSFKKLIFGRYLLWSIIGNFFIQTVWLDKIPKYVSYSYPLILILTAAWIANNKRYAGLVFTMLILPMAVNFVLSMASFPEAVPRGRIAGEIYVLPGIQFEYNKNPWPIRKIVADISQTADRPTLVLVATDHHVLNNGTVSYFANTMQKYMNMIPATEIYDPAHPKSVTEADLTGFDYIVTKSGGDYGIFVDYETTNRINAILRNSNAFSLVGTYNLPDNTQAYLYKVI